MFSFKQFSVEHDQSSMKVGTDAVLVGAWSDVNDATSVLDVGTGCGIISLMVAQRNSHAIIEAVDIHAESIEEAKGNFQRSPWSNRVNAIQCDFLELQCVKKYDIIVSNPPFFCNGILPSQESRRNARHTQRLTYFQLLNKSKSILNNDGKISIITPIEAFQEIIDICVKLNLYVTQMCKVFPIDNSQAKRILWEIALVPSITNESTLVIEKSQGNYTAEFKALCRDFYLKF